MAKIERESINFKLPKPLTAALREKAHELETTATDLVIQGLEHVLGEGYQGVDNSTNNALDELYARVEALEESNIETSIESRLIEMETQLNYLESRLDRRKDFDIPVNLKQDLLALDNKLEALTTRIAQIEGAIAILGQRQQTAPTRRQTFNYHPPQLELQPFTEENLAKRLAATASTIRNQRETKTEKEFESWCRQRDPGGVAWRYENDGLYHPIK